MDEQQTDTPKAEGSLDRAERLTRTATRALIVVKAVSALGTAIVVAAGVIDWPIGPVVQRGIGVVAAGLFLFQANNSFRTRKRLAHWEVPDLTCLLREEAVLGCGVPLLIVLLGLMPATSWEILAAIALLLGIDYPLYELVEEEIHERVGTAEKKQGIADLEERQPLGRLGIRRTNKEIGKHKGVPSPLSVIKFFLRPAWRETLSRPRTVIIWIMFGTALLAAAAAAQEGLHGRPDPKHHHQGQGDASSEGDEAAKAGDPGASGGSASVEEGTEDDRLRCQFEPGEGAPRWAKDELYSLYFGGGGLNTTDPPGTEVGGCTSSAIVIETPEGEFVYTVGRNELGEIRSVAVDSYLGPAIFLAPAAQRVLALIHRGVVPLGGYPSKNVVGGDMTAVTTPKGTFVLVRSEKTLPGESELATPLIELPPAAAAAWVGLMREEESWLWPLRPVRSGEDQVFPLSSDSADRQSPLKITFDPRTGSAWRGPYAYTLPQPQLGQGELEAFARWANRM